MAKSLRNIDKRLALLRFRKLGDSILVTNDMGRYIWLSEEQFDQMLHGELSPDSDLNKDLLEKDFLKRPNYANRAADIIRWRNDFLNGGPNLHILIVTLRCNYTCQYCHASREPMDRTECDMPIERARVVVDTIFETTSPAINIEFQGGEPLANWETLKFVIEYAEEKNKLADKNVAFTLVSNLSLMDEEKLAFLIDHNVYVCTSVDGPRDLHEKNRIWTGGSSYEETVKWIQRFHDEYKKRGYDLNLFHVDALMTTTRYSLPRWKEIVDEYVKLGLKSIHIRPLNPFGFVTKTWQKIGYTVEEFIEFYKKSFDYIIELNLNGTEMIERMAAIYLTRILTDRDPNYMELRSPCGAGIGQIAYNYDGQIFTCDEGRMMSRMGDDLFKMGDAGQETYPELIESEAVKTLVLASVQEGIPLCSTCAYKPYCGVCPIYNYATQGDIFGQMPTNGRCKAALATFDHLFSYIMKKDNDIQQIFDRWVTVKIRKQDACDPY